MSNSLFKLGGLGLRQQNIIGSNLEPEIKKSLEFIKTEKEIYDALQGKKKALEIEEESLKKEMSSLKGLIGTEPEEDASYYMYKEGKDESVPYKRYSIDWNKMSSSNEVSLTNFSVQNKVKQDDTNTLKQKYNDACYKRFRMEEQEEKIELLIKNLNPKAKREHKLSEYELTNYGF